MARLVAVILFICMPTSWDKWGRVFSHACSILRSGWELSVPELFLCWSWRHERDHLSGCPILLMVFAYTIPVFFISLIITGNAIPQLGLIGNYIKDGLKIPFLSLKRSIKFPPIRFSNTRKIPAIHWISLYYRSSDGGNRRFAPCDRPLFP